MSLTFSDLQQEVLRRSVRDSGGSQFNNAVKTVINTSLFRVGRDGLWRSMRRRSTFDTVTTYSTGTGAGTFTNGSKNVTVTGATFITDGIKVGRRVSLQGDSNIFTIRSITGETTFTIDRNYSGTTITGTGAYSILAQEEYNLPIQAGHKMFMWHEEWGYPYQLSYIPDQQFYGSGVDNTEESIPVGYRMWGEDMIISQPREASVVTIASSSSSDTNISVTVFGIVSGYPDFEVISTNSTNGTTSSSGSKSFSSVERVVKSSSSVGRISCTTNSGGVTISVLPVGDTTAGILYRKVQLYPLPNGVYPINVQYYKDPYRLVNDGDVHELGQDFDEAIILLATAKMKYENNQAEGDRFLALYKDELLSLRRTNMDKIDWFPKQGKAFSSRQGMVHSQLAYSQIGPNYGPNL